MESEFGVDHSSSVNDGGNKINPLSKHSLEPSDSDSDMDWYELKDDNVEVNGLCSTEVEVVPIASHHTLRADSDVELAEKLPKENSESDVIGVIGTGNTSDIDSGLHTANCSTMPQEIKGHVDGNLSGLKRARVTDDEQTSVHIIYKSLSRKSKKKLEELLQQWSEWHAQQCSSSKGLDEDLESGEETYFPALHVNPDNSCTISCYIDNQVNKKQRTGDFSFRNDSVPVYDRNFVFALTSGDGLTNKESGLDILNASRCFNCDSYSHTLKECSKPFDKVAVSNARKSHQLKRNRPAGPRVLTRYYQNTPGGKFDGLTPGSLDPETRKLLGLGEFDPPPWLNRMREIGYPPGYLDLEDDDQPSGITVYDNEDAKEENETFLKLETSEPKRKMSVEFPGINAPIPVSADQSRWATPPEPTGFNSFNNSPLWYRPNCSTELHFKDHSHHARWQSGYTEESSPLMSNYAHNYMDHSPNSLPLLSNYANSYWDYINQPSPFYSSYAYRNS